jgi:hypothetical protein
VRSSVIILVVVLVVDLEIPSRKTPNPPSRGYGVAGAHFSQKETKEAKIDGLDENSSLSLFSSVSSDF